MRFCLASLRTLLRQGSLVLITTLSTPLWASADYWHTLLRNDRQTQAEAIAALEADPQGYSCDYPARRAYLAAQFPAQAAQWPSVDCPELTTWLQGIDAEQATLIFASDYLNNPSSMFGHTLLRIDAKSHGDDVRLLSYAINYSAQTNTQNGLEFAWKGLTGGYPGLFSLLPYYEKVKEYNDWESRDLWEYELTLTPAEVHRLLLTYWEWRKQPRPYYFLSANCSYELLALLEMARPGLDLQSQFPVHAIPSDTLRAVLQQPGLLKRITYRAASGTQRQLQIAHNSPSANTAANQLIEHPQLALESLSEAEQAQALDLAYDELYDRHVQRDSDAEAPHRLRQLLIRRATLSTANQRPQPAQPAHDPSQGHGTARWGVGWAHSDNQDYAVVHIRPAYHDWLDNPQGYRRGARIDFLAGSLRVDEHAVKLNEFTLVGIDSLAPINALRTPKSWAVRVGAQRALSDQVHSRERHTSWVVDGSSGLTWDVGALCFGQGYSSLQGGQAWADGWQLSAGLRAGCIGEVPGIALRWQVEALPQYAWPDNALRQEYRLGTQLDLGGSQALRLRWDHQQQHVHSQLLTLDWLHYF